MRPFADFCLVLLVLFTLITTQNLAAIAAERPNFLLIIADDLGTGHVGWQNPKVKTPHLDKLANAGVKLDRHYVAPVCSPTRVSFMSGRYWSRFGCNNPIGSHPTATDYAMRPGTATIGTTMKKAGYQTCFVGKWHLGTQPKHGPEQFGFDYFYGVRGGGCSPMTHRWLGLGPSMLWRNEKTVEEEGHITDLFGNEAAEWVSKNAKSDKPFCVVLCFTAPHVPLLESDKWMNLYKETAPDQSHQLYWAAISHLDAAVGEVVTKIEKAGKLENTVVLFFGDNGAPGQPNRMQIKAKDRVDQFLNVRLPGDNLPYRGKKGDVYEGGIRTPSFITWKARLKPHTCTTPLHVSDWMPTFAALVGVKTPESLRLDGRNVLPILEGKGKGIPGRTIYTLGNGQLALHEDAWKLVQRGNKKELYNLSQDVGEKKDLATANPEKIEQLIKLLKSAAANDRDALPNAKLRKK